VFFEEQKKERELKAQKKPAEEKLFSMLRKRKKEKQSKRTINWRPKTKNYTEKKKTDTVF